MLALVSQQSINVIELLLKNGANVNIISNSGISMLDYIEYDIECDMK